MLSSSSQYLHPDYLQPLPTTLDAKKSPLALLAQTCSSIGKDSSPSKSIIPPIEKKDVHRSSPERRVSSADLKRSPSTDDKKDSGRDTGKSARSSIPPKDAPRPGSSRPGSTENRTSPMINVDTTSKRSDSGAGSGGSVTTSSSSSLGTSQSNSRISLSCGNMLLEVNHQESANSSSGLSKPLSVSHGSTLPPSSAQSSVFRHSHPLSGGLPTYGSFPLYSHGHALEQAAAAHSALYSPLGPHGALGLTSAAAVAAAAAAANASALKLGAHGGAPSPYVSYARVRTPTGGTTLVPICRDPYCTNCQLTVQNAHMSSTCTAAGCTQCAHEKALTTLPPGFGFPPSPASLSFGLSASSALGGAFGGPGFLPSSLYPPSMLPSSAGLPYVCNWVAGSEYCGKRFPTSEELLQHLRTHTSSAEGPSPLATPYSLASYSLSPSALAAAHGHYASAGSLSPNSLRRAYPLSLSPVSSMLNASRYHPYKSALSSLPGAPSAAALAAHSPLAAYYSPYALYGQRLGAALAP